MPYITDENGMAVYVTADDPRLARSEILGQAASYIGTENLTSSGTTSSGSTTTSSGGGTLSKAEIIAIFEDYGLDPYTHFDGTARNLDETVAKGYTEDQLRDILQGAPADSTSRIDQNQDGTVNAADIELLFSKFGLDPAVNNDGTERPGGAEGLAERINNGTLRWQDLINTLSYGSGLPPSGSMGGTDDLSPAPPAAGSGDVPGVWGGGQLVKVQRPNADDKWVMLYDWQGNKVAWEFSSYEQMVATIGDPMNFGGFSTLSESNYNSNVTVAGSTAEIQGPGSFEGWIRQTINSVALESGVGDPTLWGQYMADPDVQAVIFQAAVGEWSDAQTMAAIRQTDFYQNTLFPGITAFYNTDDPEAQWYQYFANVRPVLEALGVDPGSDGYRQVVGDMLKSGVSDQTFVNMQGVFMRAATSESYANALDEWMQIETGRGLDFDTWYDVLAGTPEAEVRDVVNKATIAYQNEQTGAGLTDEQIARIGENRAGVTDSEAAGFLNQYLESLTSVRDVVGRYGVTADEILSAATGISSESGRSLEEIQRLTRQAAGEAGRMDDEKIKFFLDFTPMGTPRRPGLAGLAPESG